ncbi:hypothetical protein SLS60_006930 [Paraconiothyrium brasiliense]|uniref:F-box domain-containing protein n=1 Tax=Paraconiothyrium brasiliense TaxID=300254 RepID=A0ABR3R7X7_9PLEO
MDPHNNNVSACPSQSLCTIATKSQNLDMDASDKTTRVPNSHSDRTPLLDLPPELFQNIIHDVVTDLGVARAWTIRSVCRTFAAEIECDAFTRQVRQNIGLPCIYRFEPRPFWEQWFSKYMSYHVKRLHDYLDPADTFLHRIHDMTKFFNTELHLDTQGKEWVLEMMCDLVAWRTDSPRLAQFLGWFSTRHSTDSLPLAITPEMKLAAASYLGDAESVKRLLPDADFFKYVDKDHVPFGNPLGNAAEQGHDHIVLLIVDDFRTGKLDFLHPRIEQMESSYMSCSYEEWGEPSHCTFRGVLAAAVRYCGKDTVKGLLRLHRYCTNTLDPREYLEWLYDAIDSDDPRMAKLIFDANPDKIYKATDYPKWNRWSFEKAREYAFAEACRLNDVHLVKAFLDNPLVGPGHVWEDVDIEGRFPMVWSRSCPLAKASKYGSLEAVMVIMDAGASVDGPAIPVSTVDAKILCRPKCPLEYAAESGALSVVQYLIMRGANVQNVRWDGNQFSEAVYNELRTVKMAKYGEDCPTYDIWFRDEGWRGRI